MEKQEKELRSKYLWTAQEILHLVLFYLLTKTLTAWRLQNSSKSAEGNVNLYITYVKEISSFKFKILLKDQDNKALLQINETGDWGGFKITQKNNFTGWGEWLKKK